ncbi:MAG TPA: pyruvate:ferredoxin (flavodoxin) oxidoreductase [Lachnospiraceae bacterium]|nr:pyruvate:ferredoxin (flavodoxin) oxidoreductase [Lachnospiraceae bacterium]
MKRRLRTMDGNEAAAHVSYAYSEVAAIYPITPSSPMAAHVDEWSTAGRENIFGQRVHLSEMQSEAGAAGAVHGSLAAGALTTTFTASQGLLLMIPNMYKMAGELLPAVFDVSSRTIASHALSIFGDHQDVYACRQTGFAMLCSSSVQEVMDLTPVSHCAAMKGRVPFVNFFDGFRTSHEYQKVETWDYEDLKDLIDMDAIKAFRQRALNPEHPCERGSVQQPDIFFQAREASNRYYDALPAVVEDYMNQINQKIGTNYGLFNYYGARDAEKIIIAMGSVCETIEETIDYLMKQGEKVGLVKVRLYRPFSVAHLCKVIPDSVKEITVLDRTKEPGSVGEPLFLDVLAALHGSKFEKVKIYSGRYGISSKDTTPGQILAVYKNTEKKRFTIGITDDVTNLSLHVNQEPDTAPKDMMSCKFWGLGADGTVGANKNSVKIIGENTDLYVQAYFAYDSKKSGGVTISHLRFGKEKIRSTYLIKKADFVACHNQAYVRLYNMVQDLKDGGVFLLNCQWEGEELAQNLPGQVKKYIADHKIRFYVINGIKIGKEVGLGGRINTILQAAFFKLSGVIPAEEAIGYMKEAAEKTYAQKGSAVVHMNYEAIDRGTTGVVEVIVPEEWKNSKEECLLPPVSEKNRDGRSLNRKEAVDFANNIQIPITTQEGDQLEVSKFIEYVDGTTPSGTSAFERRGVAVDVPVWVPENCVQCNQCAFVCPHAVIRPIALTEEDKSLAPDGTVTTPMLGFPNLSFGTIVSTEDCMGCGSCANVCPGKQGKKALVMTPHEQVDKRQQKAFDWCKTLPQKPELFEKFKVESVKGSQFKKPLLEFSGACGGCGETPYAKLVTHLFGERLMIANATGCSSIWGNSSPSTPYTVNNEGRGPVWSNSLFEDNAEFGYGMKMAQDIRRDHIRHKVEELVEQTQNETVKQACNKYLDTFYIGNENITASDELVRVLMDTIGSEDGAKASEIIRDKDILSKKSQWIIGGDGWAYDIGFSGLDHVFASGEDVNILVLDTEVYSNTGGQASKATQMGATAEFASNGKALKKKNLAAIAMSYENVYVAQVSMGANSFQCVKAFSEAESYHGTSIIIAYAPCILHGISGGMAYSQTEEKRAVECGYWNIFRFDPRLRDQGKNAFMLDSQKPKLDYKEFLAGEVRFNALARSNPKRAMELFEKAERNAMKRFESLEKLAAME